MQYMKLGRTGLDVSPICIGCMGFGDPSRGHPAWSLDEAASRPVIRHAIEAGINFFDTANLTRPICIQMETARKFWAGR
jgi:aryl-alcohol dehydrogenase-like predicted oxidoreductase